MPRLKLDIVTTSDTKGIDDVVTKTEGMKSKVASSMKGMAASFAGGFLGAVSADAIVGFVKDSVGAASDLAETMSKTQAVFGDAGDSIVAWSQTSAQALGMSQQGALDAASTFGVFGKAAGLAGPDLSAFSTSLSQTGADLASFGNTSPEEAIAALASGLRGEAEPLRKYGILMDDAALKAEALKLGLISTTSQALTPQQKVLASQAVIMSQLGDAQGDFARTSEGAANQQRIMSARMQDLQATVGGLLLPAFTALLGGILSLVDGFGTMAGWVQSNMDVIGPLAVVFGVAAIAMNTTAIAAAAYSAIGSAIRAMTIAWTAGQWLLNAALNANPISLIIILIAAFVAAIVILWQRNEGFRTAVLAVWSAVQGGISAAVNGIRGFLSGLVSFIGDIPGWTSSALSTVGNIILAPYRIGIDAVRSIIGGIPGIVGAVGGWVSSAFSGVTEAITRPFRSAIDTVKGIIGQIKGVWNGVAGAINGFSFNVGVPDWVPLIGGNQWTFRAPHVPMLARGGWVTGPTLAMVGEGRHPEVVAPEPMLRRLLEQAVGVGAAAPTVYVTVEIDGQEISSRARVVLVDELGGQARRAAMGVRYA